MLISTCGISGSPHIFVIVWLFFGCSGVVEGKKKKLLSLLLKLHCLI